MQQQAIRKLTKAKSIATDGNYLFTMIQQRNLSQKKVGQPRNYAAMYLNAKKGTERTLLTNVCCVANEEKNR